MFSIQVFQPRWRTVSRALAVGTRSSRKSPAVEVKNRFCFCGRRLRQRRRKGEAHRIRAGIFPAFRGPEASGLHYQRSPFSLNCVDVQPHFLRKNVIQPPFLRWISHRSLTGTIDQRPSARSTCGREHQTARAHHHFAALRRRDSRCKDEAAVHFNIRRSMSPRTNGQTIMIANSFSQGSSGRYKPNQV